MIKINKFQKTTLWVVGVVFVVVAFGYLLQTQRAVGLTTLQNMTRDSEYVTYTFFATTTSQATLNSYGYATSTNATSTNIVSWTNTDSPYDIITGAFNVAGAKRVSVYFQRSSTIGVSNRGSSTFYIQVSNDGSTWIPYRRLLGATTSGITVHPVNKAVITGTSTDIYSLDLTNAFKSIRCIAAVTYDGESTCKASAQF